MPAKRQLQWKVGSTIVVKGASKMERRFVILGKGKIAGRETLFIQPKKKAKQQR